MGAQRWEVVGGKKDGIVVREGRDLKSEESPGGRLACGSLVEELELRGERLRFRRLSGDGPEEGWVSLRLKGNDLVVRTDKEAPNGAGAAGFHICCCAICESGHMMPTLRIARALAQRDSFRKVTFLTNAYGGRVVQGWLEREPDPTGKISLQWFEDGTDQELMDLAHAAAQDEDGSYVGQIDRNMAAHCGESLVQLLRGPGRADCFIIDSTSWSFREFLETQQLQVGERALTPPYLETSPFCILMYFMWSHKLADPKESLSGGLDTYLALGGKAADRLSETKENLTQDAARAQLEGQLPQLPHFELLQCFALPSAMSDILPKLGPYTQPVGIITDEGKTELPSRIKEFLNRKGAAPVIYVSMGSQAYFTADQLQRFLEGLKSSEWRVLWSLRQAQQDLLPGAFDQLGDGFLVMTWCPQLDILRSPKTAAFVSHCGWGATCEAFTTATPVVGFPMFADQPMNSMFLEMCGMGKQVGEEPLDITDMECRSRRMQKAIAVREKMIKPLREVFAAEDLRNDIAEVVVKNRMPYKMAAQFMRNYTKASGGANKAVELVEGYCKGPYVQEWTRALASQG